MEVKKSDGTYQEFDVVKIKDGICEAFNSVGEECQEGVIDSLVKNLYVYDRMTSKEIRRQVEECLMSINKKVARAYIQKYDEDRVLRKDEDFVRNYINASNASTGSKYDSNANVDKKNIVTLGQELHKGKNIQQNRYIMQNKIRSLYSKKLADQYIKDLESHVLYKHDESGTPGYPYCVAITMYPFLLNGLKPLGGQSVAPTDLKSFCGEFINLVYSVSSQFMGACMHKDQTIFVNENGINNKYTSKDFVEKYIGETPLKFENYQGEWEYAPVNGVQVLEDGKMVNVRKVYRRKYNDDIYTIYSKDGYKAKVTKDHKFKQLFKGRIFETKAENLYVDDTLFMNKDYTPSLNWDGKEYKTGWLVGMICGDGSLALQNQIRLSVNYEQVFLADIFNDYSNEIWGYTLHQNYDKRGCYEYRKHNQDFYEKVKTHIIGTNTYDKHIDINGKSIDYLVGFLDGLFCSDGSYSKSHGITIALTNKELCQNVADITDILDICHKTPSLLKATRGNRKDSYYMYIPSRVLKYLKHTPLKVLSRGKRFSEEQLKDLKESREIYYYGKDAFRGHNKSSVRLLWSNSKKLKEDWLKTDVVTNIEVEKNEGGYVYEIETDTHWYNCGGFITHNCATPEFLMYMDYFIRKDYGDDYLELLNEVVEKNRKNRTLEEVIENAFQQVVHSMNMPAGNRGYQTVFWNLGYFDKNYFEGVFSDFVFPDGSKPIWETLSWLQKKFMRWFNEERTKYVLTFPVETMAMLTDGHDVVDKEYADFSCEMWSKGHSFFCYLSDSPDSLSSCCRLRNSLKDSEIDEEHNHTTHQFSMGTASVATGSKSVMTINLNRIIQDATIKYFNEFEGKEIARGTQVSIKKVQNKEKLYEYIANGLTEMTERVHKYQRSFNEIIKDFYKANMLDVYSAGFISLNKQYLTIGVNGLTDAAEFLSIDANLNKEYEEFVNLILETINKSNKKDRTRECMYNTEFVPGENLSNKNYNWDKKDGYFVSPKHIMYSSYFFNPEDDSLSVIDKMKLHGNTFVQYLDGGQAAHLNLNEHLSFEQYRKLLKVASEYGCSYFTYNVKNTVCNDCGYISKDTLDTCPKCGSKNLDYLTRIIGYLKRISAFSEPRQIEANMRYYSKE